MVKPGYRTSEFWFTLVSFIFSGLYLFGIIGDFQNKEDLIQETSRGVEAVILIIGQLTILYKYVKGRTELKQTWWNTATNDEKKEANLKNSKTTKKSNTKRTTSPKTRKKKSNDKPKPIGE